MAMGVIMAILVGIAGRVAGARFDVLARINSFPGLPLIERGHTVYREHHRGRRRGCCEPCRRAARRASRDALPPPGRQGRLGAVTRLPQAGPRLPPVPHRSQYREVLDRSGVRAGLR